jgi:hypothetical protein
MQFNELRIRRMTYGPHDGKILATLEIHGKAAKMELIIGEPASLRILQACAEVVADAGAEQAAEFRREFMDAVSHNSRAVRTDGPPRDSGTHEAVVGADQSTGGK